MAKYLNSLTDAVLLDLLRRGAVGVITTDTVYGLVCSATNEQAVANLYARKNRQSKPGTVIAANVEQLVHLGIKARYLKPVAHYWPNPISIVIPNYDLKYIHDGVGSIAVRIPKNQELIKLLSKSGPLLTSSANQPGESEAVTIEQAHQYFGEQIDFYVDGGDLTGRMASTVIRVVDDAVEVLREGAVAVNQDGSLRQ